MKHKYNIMVSMLCITHSMLIVCAGRSSVLDQRLKKEPLPTEKPLFSLKGTSTAARAARLKRQLPAPGSLVIPVRAYLNQIHSLEQSFSAAECALRHNDARAIVRLQDDLKQAQIFFAESLEELKNSNEKKIKEEFVPIVEQSVEEWKNSERQRLLAIAQRIKKLEEQMNVARENMYAPQKKQKTVHFADAFGDVQTQLEQCRRFYSELNRQHEELIHRFVQTVAMRSHDKKAFDELRSQLDKLIAGRNELQETYAQDRAQFMQEISRLHQQPEQVPASLLQEVVQLREQVAQLSVQLQEVQDKAHMNEIYRGIMEEQRDAYKNALDDIFAGIVVGIPYEELADPQAQKAAELKAKAESDKMIANIAAEQMQKLNEKNLISVAEIREKIDKKIEAMIDAAQNPKKQLKAEPPKKK